MRKKLQERLDQMPTHRNSLKKQSMRGMDHERSIKISRPTDHPVNPGCEVVEHVACPPKDDIFGDLPLLESSKVMFHTGVDILPTIIEDSFVGNQNGPDAISETEPLKLMPIADISKQTSPPLEDLVKKEQTPDEEAACIFPNDAGRSRSSSAEFDGLLNHTSVTMAKTSLPEMQLKSTYVPALSSYCNEGAKSGSSNCAQGFNTNTDCFQEMERPGTTPVAARTRTEAIKKEDAAVHGLNNTSVTMAKTSLPETQLKSTHVPALSSYNDETKSGPSNHPQGRFYTNTNCFQEMKRPGTSSDAVRIRTETVTEDRDATVHGLNNTSVTMAKTCLPEMQLNSTHVPGLSSYSNDGTKSGSSNQPQDRCHTNTNCFQEMRRPGTSSVAVRTRTEAIEKDRDAAVHGKKGTCISGRLVPTEYHPSCEGSLLPSVISQRTVIAGINADGISSCRSRPAQEYVPASSPCKVASNMYHEKRKSVDRCTSLSMDDQGSRYSKVYPGSSPASIMSFMKLPGLEKMEISSYAPRTGENNFMNGQSANTVRCQQQKQVSGVTNTMQGQNKIGFRDSQAGKKAPDGFVGRDNCHSHQPTMRLMGKTVSLCKGSMERDVPTTGKAWIDKNVIEGNRPSSISCQLPPKRVSPYQDSVIPRTRVHESSDTLARIHNSTFAEARPIVSDAQIHRLPQTNIVSSAVKDCTWNSGSQFGRQAQVNQEYVTGNSRTMHRELSQPPELISTPRNQYLHYPASSMYAEEHTFVGSAVNRSSPSLPQWSLNTSMQGKYQNPTSFVYEDPRFVPTHQPPCQVPGANLFWASNISFRDYGTKNAESRNSYQRAHPSLPTSAASKFHDYCTNNSDSRYSYQGAHPSFSTSVASKSISTISPMCTRGVLNIDGRQGVSLVDERSKRPGYADNVSQQPAKRQLVAGKPEFTTSMFPCMEKYSFGWSLNDTVGPRMLDFSNKNSRKCRTNIKK